MTDLWPHQVAEIPLLLSGSRLLAWEPGTGKTRAILEAFARVKAAQPAARMLTIVPANLRTQWAEVAREMGFTAQIIDKQSGRPDATSDLVIVSYHGIVNKALWQALMKPKWAVLTLDEAHYCKTPSTTWTKAVFGARKNSPACLMRRADKLWMMTGTPMMLDPSDLWVFVSRVFTDILDKTEIQNRQQWVLRWCQGYDTPYGFKITGARDPDELHKLLSPYMSRVRKREVMPQLKEPLLDKFRLPPRKIEVSAIDNEELKRLIELLEGDDDGLSLDMLDSDPQINVLRRQLGLAKADEVADIIAEEAAQTGDKQLVFYQHTDVGMAIFRRLKEVGLKPVLYNGQTTSKQKLLNREAFINDPAVRVFIGQIDASGTGLDGLQIASRVHVVEEPWTPGKLDQIVSRADRGGQQNQVHATTYVIAGSHDDRVSKALEKRARMIAAVIDGQLTKKRKAA